MGRAQSRWNFDTVMIIGAGLLVTHECCSASGPICGGAVAVALVDAAIVVGAALVVAGPLLLVTLPVLLVVGLVLLVSLPVLLFFAGAVPLVAGAAGRSSTCSCSRARSVNVVIE